MKQNIKILQKSVQDCFEDNFGRTPLRQRIDDIFKESIELSRFTDLKNLEEETGDLLSSLIQLCNENRWDVSTLVNNTLEKITKRKLQYKTLGRKKQVAILAGAFNPIHNGHIKLAQFVLNTSRTFDEVFITPCNKHLYNKNLVSVEHRLKMCNLAVEVDGRIKVFDYEIKHELGGETYHFVKQLLSEDFSKDQYDFSYIIGQDNANTFDKWVNYEDLERMIRFVVVGRSGVPRDEKVNWYLKPPHIYLAQDKLDIPEVSSTTVRDIFDSFWKSQNSKCYESAIDRNLIDTKIVRYILNNNLYNNF